MKDLRLKKSQLSSNLIKIILPKQPFPRLWQDFFTLTGVFSSIKSIYIIIVINHSCIFVLFALNGVVFKVENKGYFSGRIISFFIAVSL